MTDELRAACERLLDDGNDDYWEGNGPAHYPDRDGGLVARAMLALLSPDEQGPITPEWLLACGSREPHGMDYAAPPTLSLPGGRYGVLVQSTPREWHWCRGSKVIAAVRTRGDVRRLCAALGHPIKETP